MASVSVSVPVINADAAALAPSVTTTHGPFVASVTLYPPTVSIEPDSMLLVWAEIRPLEARVKAINWTTSAYAVASVVGSETEALIMGNSTGDATITATTEDGDMTATCTVTVANKAVVNYVW